MKIALLNFPFDNNYGGNLQRFALMRVLEDMGHEPEHLLTKLYWEIPSIFTIFKIIVRAIIFRQFPHVLYNDIKEKYIYNKQNRSALKFYNKYINHTSPIIHPSQLKNYQNYDAYIVGSDQVWRKSMSWKFPYETMFFSWLHDEKRKRIAYGVSFGTDEKELTTEHARAIGLLYNKFYATSVREKSALEILQDYSWTSPKAIQVLDPTLLLDQSVYMDIVEKSKTNKSKGNMFCYVLDMDDTKKNIIADIAKTKGLIPFYIGIDKKEQPTIEQWIRSFIDAEYVVTDSFHGCVFSIIFKKPFKLMINQRRGVARFKSLFSALEVDEENQMFDWENITKKLLIQQKKSLDFLRYSLS